MKELHEPQQLSCNCITSTLHMRADMENAPTKKHLFSSKCYYLHNLERGTFQIMIFWASLSEPFMSHQLTQLYEDVSSL